MDTVSIQDLATELSRRGFRASVRQGRIDTNATREQVTAVMDALSSARRADSIAGAVTRPEHPSRRAVKHDGGHVVRYG